LRWQHQIYFLALGGSRPGDDKIKGEGNHEADREYREKTRKFVDSGKVDKAVKKARDIDPEQAAAAEKAGRNEAREVNPQVHRNHNEPTKNKDTPEGHGPQRYKLTAGRTV